jgi:hypothetical protein
VFEQPSRDWRLHLWQPTICAAAPFSVPSSPLAAMQAHTALPPLKYEAIFELISYLGFPGGLLSQTGFNWVHPATRVGRTGHVHKG